MNYICIKSTEIVCDNETLVLMRYTTLAGFAFIEIWRNLRGYRAALLDSHHIKVICMLLLQSDRS